MNWKNNLWTLLLFALLHSCSNSEEGKAEDNFEVKGKVSNAGQRSVYLEAISSDGTIDVAQTTTDEEGNFVLTGNISEMGLYELRLGEDDLHILPLTLSPGEKIKIEAEYETFVTQPTFSGAKWTSPLNQYMRLFDEFANAQSTLARTKGASLTEDQMIAEYKKLRKPLDDFAKGQMTKDPLNPVNLILVSALSPSLGYQHWDTTNLEVYRKVLSGFQSKYTNSPVTENMAYQYEQMIGGYNEFVQSEKTVANKLQAPEISLKNPEGKNLKLSDLKGKFVLIDFWASWCGPCRKENPNVVRLYKQYKDKNFTVFSVSLDKSLEAWKNAILMDGLIWPYHVSDLKAWDTPLTQVYGFNGIPHTVLLDKEGKIIARNLRGESLEQKLKEIL